MRKMQELLKQIEDLQDTIEGKEIDKDLTKEILQIMHSIASHINEQEEIAKEERERAEENEWERRMGEDL